MRSGADAREVGPAPEAADGELDLGAVGRALGRKKLWVLAPAAIVALVTFIGVNLVTPRYKSEARILIEGRESIFLRPEAEKGLERERTVDAETVTSQVQLVLSREVARQVIKQLKLGEKAEFDPVLRRFNPIRQVLMVVGVAKDPLRMTPEERILESYYERLTAFPVDKSRVITVEFQSSDPELAAGVANAIAEAYIGLQQSVKQDQTRAAGRWLAGEIESLRGKVGEAEAKVEQFRSKSNLFIGSNNTSLSNQQLSEVNSQLAAARSQKADADVKARLIREMIKSGRPIESSEIGNSELIRRLSEQRVTLQAQLAEQSATLLEKHPRIKELKAQIADLDRQIRSEAEKVVRNLESDARIATARVEQASANLDHLKRSATSTNKQDVQLRALEREAKAQRDLLESYLAKYRETTARESLGAAPADARIISMAIVSNTPYFPKKLPIVLIATLATLLLGAGFITTGELLAGNVYRPGFVVQPGALFPEAVTAQVPPVAETAVGREGVASAGDTQPHPAMPEPQFTAQEPLGYEPAMPTHYETQTDFEPVTQGPEAEGQLATADRPESPDAVDAAPEKSEPKVAPSSGHADAIAELAAALKQNADGARRSVVFCLASDSSAAHTAIALARKLAERGRVVLVDLAFGSPSVAAVSSDPAAPGIAELLRGTSSFGDIITRDRASRVHVISAGEAGPAGASLLSSERLAIAMDALGRTYEHLIIDAGVIADLPLRRFARLAPQAVLVSAAASGESVQAAQDMLLEAGFTSVALFAGVVPEPETMTPPVGAAAA